MPQRIKTEYPGVYFRPACRIRGKGIEKVFYITFKQNGKMVEEKVRRQYADDMIPARAALIHGERIEGRRHSRKEKRDRAQAQHLAEKNRWTIGRLWAEYKESHGNLKGLTQDECHFRNYLLPHLAKKKPHELTPFEVDRLRVQLLKQKKPARVRNILELLRQIVLFGGKKQLCPVLTFSIEMPRTSGVKTEDLNPTELEQLLVTLEKHKHLPAATMMKLVLFTGMRRGELFRLKWEDINFTRSFITLREPEGDRDQVIPLSEQAQ